MTLRSVAIAYVAVVAMLVLLRPWWILRTVRRLRSSATPWPEIASRIWVWKTFGAIGEALMPLAAGIVVGVIMGGTGGWAVGGLVVLAVRATLVVNATSASYRLFERVPTGSQLRRQVLAGVALGSPVPLALSWPLATALSPIGVGLLAIALLAVACMAAYHTTAVYEAIGLAGPLPPGCALVPIDGERLGRIESPQLNAVALPLQRRVLFTDLLLQRLSPDELRAIHAHELSHLGEPRRHSLGRLGMGAGFAASIGLAPRPVAFIVVIYASILVCRLLWTKRRARAHEVRADEVAQSGSGSHLYATALVRIHEANLIPVDLRRGTHPSLVERLRALGVTGLPFPLPRRPTERRSRGIKAAIFLVTTCGGALIGAYVAARG